MPNTAITLLPTYFLYSPSPGLAVLDFQPYASKCSIKLVITFTLDPGLFVIYAPVSFSFLRFAIVHTEPSRTKQYLQAGSNFHGEWT